MNTELMTSATKTVEAVHRWRAFRHVAILGVALLSYGCTPGATQKDDTAEAQEQQVLADQLERPVLDGALASFSGQVLLIDFWTTWSLACRNEVPSINRVHELFREKDVAIVGLTMDKGTPADVSVSVSALGLAYPWFQSHERIQEKLGGIRVVPTKILLDREGRLVKRYEGIVPVEELVADIEALL